jgi:hypothetical protein
MRDGLYKVAFTTPRGSGTGVLAIQGGRVRGGDSRTYYVGTFDENNGQITAHVKVDLHTNTPFMASVFGMDRVNVTLTGSAQGDSAQLTGTATEAPGVTFRAVLTRLAD